MVSISSYDNQENWICYDLTARVGYYDIRIEI